MIRATLFALTLVAAAPLAAQQTAASSQVQPGTQGVITTDDYPDDALRLGQQGTVAMRMTVGTNGRVSDCTVTVSSASPSLDARSCEIMVERARFTPALDSAGRPTTGSYEQRITWRIADDPMMPIRLARAQWSHCVMSEAARLAPGPLRAGKIADQALAACRSAESKYKLTIRQFMPDAETHAMVGPVRARIKTAVAELVARTRAKTP